ncbi:MAG TPA: RNA polymerase sigma factor [Saprospiraceae bacterium]|nr:RNA polymerase sigma factor [Saprospiraceae bacterium]HMQ83635.1 RNA polymerase sigma factor [Saprospiraceae bacterium]
MLYTTSMTEADLISACLSNDRLAQKKLYDRYCNAMYTVAYRITGDFELANDVLQEAFIKIFRGLDKFRQESSLGAWIKTIVIRTALSKIKQRHTYEALDNQHYEQAVNWGHSLDVEYLEKAIQALPEGYRAVFVLIEIEGYSHKEVAELLNISVGTSKSQLFHAKKRLREALKDY